MNENEGEYERNEKANLEGMSGWHEIDRVEWEEKGRRRG